MTQSLLTDLARVKALFQARAVAMHLGVKPPETLPSPTQSNEKNNE
jgi:hypothetical protein